MAGLACVLSRITLTLGRVTMTCSLQVLPQELVPFLGLGTCVAALTGTVLLGALSRDLRHVWLFIPVLSLTTLAKYLSQSHFLKLISRHRNAANYHSAFDYNVYKLMGAAGRRSNAGQQERFQVRRVFKVARNGGHVSAVRPASGAWP